MTPEEWAKFDGPDNTDITDAEAMWRRIIRKWVVPDSGDPPGSRLSSQAFEEKRVPPSPCSVIRAAEGNIEHVQKDTESSVGAIQAGIIRGREFKLVSSPDPDEPGHHHMVAPNFSKGQQKKARLALANATEHVRGPLTWGPNIPPPG